MATQRWYIGIEKGMESGNLLWLGNYSSDDPCLESWSSDFRPTDIHISAPFDEETLVTAEAQGQVGVYVTREAFADYMA